MTFLHNPNSSQPVLYVISRSRTIPVSISFLSLVFPLFPRFFLPLLPPLPTSFCLHLTLSYSSFLSFPLLTLPHFHPTTPHPTPPILPNCFSHSNAVLRSFLILFYPNFYYTVLSTFTITFFTTDQTYQVCSSML